MMTQDQDFLRQIGDAAYLCEDALEGEPVGVVIGVLCVLMTAALTILYREGGVNEGADAVQVIRDTLDRVESNGGALQ